MKHIKLGGALRPLQFTINALIEFEELTGLDINDLDDRMKISRIKNIRALAYVAFKHGHKLEAKGDPDFTLEDVGNWLNKGTISKITDAFIDDTSTGEEGDEIEEVDKKKQVGETLEPSRSAA